MHDHVLNIKVAAANEKRISIVADNIFPTVICHLLHIMVQYDVVLKMQSEASEIRVVRILMTHFKNFSASLAVRKMMWGTAGQRFQQTV